MIRHLTVDERPPQPGDVIRRGRRRLEIHHWGWDSQLGLSVLAFDGRGLTRSIGPCPEGGWSCNVSPATWYGWSWWPPYRYESRADGGSITHPLDAGSWV